MLMYEQIGFMRRHMTLDELRRSKWSVENEIAKWESRLRDLSTESSREQLRYHQVLLRNIERVIAEKESIMKGSVAYGNIV